RDLAVLLGVESVLAVVPEDRIGERRLRKTLDVHVPAEGRGAFAHLSRVVIDVVHDGEMVCDERRTALRINAGAVDVDRGTAQVAVLRVRTVSIEKVVRHGDCRAL